MYSELNVIFYFSDLLALHRIATLRHDELGQVCVNFLLGFFS